MFTTSVVFWPDSVKGLSIAGSNAWLLFIPYVSISPESNRTQITQTIHKVHKDIIYSKDKKIASHLKYTQ